MKIGLALSGGGVRATVFHLGVLARLADQSLFEETSFISTVSGGSLAIGLVFSKSHNTWPSSGTYRTEALPALRTLLTAKGIQWSYAWRVVVLPWRLVRGRASVLARVMRSKWQIAGALSDLPLDNPRWVINATCYETGKNWRFMRKRMGDYLTNYVLNPNFPLADALAASAAVPGVIGPLSLRAADYEWHAYLEGSTTETQPVAARFPKVRLWDGGVYDNLGVEALFKPDKGYREGIDFLLVSDASALLASNPPRFKAPHRLLEAAMDQVRSLRARTLMQHFKTHPRTGVYLQIGNTAEQIFGLAGVDPPPNWTSDSALDEDTVFRAATLETTLRRLTEQEFDGLFRHGYEVADSTLVAYCPDEFQHIPFKAINEITSTS